MVIYDEAGNGKLELREEMNTGKHPFVFHLPSWSHGNCCTIAISPTAGPSLIGLAFNLPPAWRNGIYELSNGLCETVA
jgi:hypothetical protein